MQLEPLARRGPDCVVAVLVRESIEGQIQLRWNETAWATGSQHHSIVFLLPLDPIVAVVLLVGAVELEDLDRVLGEVCGVEQQF